MIYAGVDLHKTQFTVCIRHKKEVLHKEYRNDAKGYEAFISDIQGLGESRKRIKVAVETVGNVWHFVRQVEGSVGEVQVVNTMKMKLLTASSKKTDKNDAMMIAEHLEKDILPTVRLPDEKSRRIAKYVKVRDRYVKIMTRLKNQIHGIFMEEGQNLKKDMLTSRKRIRQILEMEMEEEVSFLITGLVEDLLNMKDRVVKIEKKLEELTEEDEDVRLLRTIPGTGLVNASAVRSILGDVKRFDHPKKVAAYAGLVPWVSNSNETVRHGHITRRGSKILRNAFVQMAMGVIREGSRSRGRSGGLYSWYKQAKSRTSGGKSIVALARKLSNIVWAMLREKAEFA